MGMFSKDAQLRIDQTIDFIAGQITDAAERQTVKTYLTTKIQQMAGPGGSVKGISDPMSMNDLSSRGTEDERKKRRALILIEIVGGMIAGATAKAMSAGELATKFPQAIETLRYVVDQNVGTGQVMRGVFDSLLAAPATFLRRHLLLVFGSETDGAMKQYFVYEKPNTPNVPIKFAFYSAKMNKHFAKSPQMDVANVPGVVWSDVPNRTKVGNAGSFAGIEGTELVDAPIMLTTQFSGCSFCWKTHLARTFAAHIMPGAEHIKGSDLPGGGEELARQLAGLRAPRVTGGDFAAPAPAGGQLRVYGRGYSNGVNHPGGYSGEGVTMTLIGVRAPADGSWSFYSQESRGGQVTAVVQVS